MGKKKDKTAEDGGKKRSSLTNFVSSFFARKKSKDGNTQDEPSDLTQLKTPRRVHSMSALSDSSYLTPQSLLNEETAANYEDTFDSVYSESSEHTEMYSVVYDDTRVSVIPNEDITNASLPETPSDSSGAHGYTSSTDTDSSSSGTIYYVNPGLTEHDMTASERLLGNMPMRRENKFNLIVQKPQTNIKDNIYESIDTSQSGIEVQDEEATSRKTIYQSLGSKGQTINSGQLQMEQNEFPLMQGDQEDNHMQYWYAIKTGPRPGEQARHRDSEPPPTLHPNSVYDRTTALSHRGTSLRDSTQQEIGHPGIREPAMREEENVPSIDHLVPVPNQTLSLGRAMDAAVTKKDLSKHQRQGFGFIRETMAQLDPRDLAQCMHSDSSSSDATGVKHVRRQTPKPKRQGPEKDPNYPDTASEDNDDVHPMPQFRSRTVSEGHQPRQSERDSGVTDLQSRSSERTTGSDSFFSGKTLVS